MEAQEACPKAYRVYGKKEIFCREAEKKGARWPYCAHQYQCGRTGRYEASKDALNCPLRNE